MNRKEKSISLNAVVNVIRTIISLLFSLITTHYITGVLKVENVGKVNFSLSVVGYFVLIAELGIQTYAVREGAKYRDNSSEFSHFATQIFVINIISMLISYCLMFFLVYCLKIFYSYRYIILILSLTILLNTMGMEWVYSVYEEYIHIALRGILFQIISAICMFLFVRSEQDVLIYALALMLSGSGLHIINGLFVHRYFTLKRVKMRELVRHLKPIFILFVSAVTCTIYVNSDITILGVLTNDHKVGIYSIATKVYLISKNVLSAIIVVSIPRLSNYWAVGNRSSFKKLSQKVIDILSLLLFPACIGLFLLSKEVVILLTNKEFLASSGSLQILSIALIFSMLSWFINSCILLPTGYDKIVMFEVFCAAAFNVILNIIFIPLYGEKAAAFSTVIAELISMIIGWCYAIRVSKIKISRDCLKTILLGNAYVAMCCIVSTKLLANIYLSMFVAVSSSALGYFLIVLLLNGRKYLKLDG